MKDKLEESGSNIRVGSNYWCLAGCGRINLICWPNGPIYKLVDRHPIDDVIALITDGTPIEGIITSTGAEWDYILRMLGKK
ncbi:hypothetical protein A3C59_00285 [Candidatus Daviesbacteria bacterium RIFCSPHIGHO2_02_FULL_36_13]|uniref:Uncharacterized protein n=1 Tax=Candidatus Daviesbacteria bacterium RIFCSPHIGHO2_02_FULL_36_13 TaxID=1797768 RepID=A0A1F5JU33_9BACT|nr:MAG: hypothetical protein A3C59_00285 [Candidatus Daviesbacteria bacterium RIFCSPHIGHO2_02_FULL_36_13]